MSTCQDTRRTASCVFLATTVDGFTSPPTSSRQLLHLLLDDRFLGDFFLEIYFIISSDVSEVCVIFDRMSERIAMR